MARALRRWIGVTSKILVASKCRIGQWQTYWNLWCFFNIFSYRIYSICESKKLVCAYTAGMRVSWHIYGLKNAARWGSIGSCVIFTVILTSADGCWNSNRPGILRSTIWCHNMSISDGRAGSSGHAFCECGDLLTCRAGVATEYNIVNLDNSTFPLTVGRSLPTFLRFDKEYPYGEPQRPWSHFLVFIVCSMWWYKVGDWMGPQIITCQDAMRIYAQKLSGVDTKPHSPHIELFLLILSHIYFPIDLPSCDVLSGDI